ncbi:MAG TPA: DUF1304 domain-containing protein [Aquaticitalea sp.]|nr:DUF1304 domain-containing protein [Aquaticitalea sp.]HNU59841.1 DUF1304 domain-containing protein [Aquaticitalea sp.]
MKTIPVILIAVVILEHLYFMYLEMFLWTTNRGIKAFGLKSRQFAEETKVLAANQGLYNGFLAAGLIFAVYKNNSSFIVFFLSCIILAGIFGAVSTKQIRLFYIQALPAILALILWTVL